MSDQYLLAGMCFTYDRILKMCGRSEKGALCLYSAEVTVFLSSLQAFDFKAFEGDRDSPDT